MNMFLGHRDGVWQVTHARNASQVIGTASAGKGSLLQCHFLIFKTTTSRNQKVGKLLSGFVFKRGHRNPQERGAGGGGGQTVTVDANILAYLDVRVVFARGRLL